MKMRVKLKVPFTDRRGGAVYAGETIGVSRKVGKHLIATGGAVAIESRTEEVPRVTVAVINPRDLRGEAKKDWLREQIRKSSDAPAYNTIVGLTAQLRSI